MNTFKLYSIEEIINNSYSFLIPAYQRGYRWGKKQIEELLKDLTDFCREKCLDNNGNYKNGEEIYCIQPLVISKIESGEYKGRWSVIDGQQRLTTIKILLLCLGEKNLYPVSYLTRKDSQDFLDDINKIDENDKDRKWRKNPDYYHMFKVKTAICNWINSSEIPNLEAFLTMLKKRVKFIVFDDTSDDPVKTFKDLNIGKISLTESELIKAILLNSNNFVSRDGDYESNNQENRNKLLTLVEMAKEWDTIEYRLQDNRFWLFFNKVKYVKPTRIDYIFKLIYDFDKDRDKSYDNYTHPVFSYFYYQLQGKKTTEEKHKYVADVWNKVIYYFNLIEEWYNSIYYYHYIGYLVAINTDKKENSSEELIRSLLEDYGKIANKNEFLEKLKERIRNTFYKENDKPLGLDYIYEKHIDNNGNIVSQKAKTCARSYLLLHNIQTVINKNEKLKDAKYSLPDFERFPFHLFNLENWDVEHIRPNNREEFEGERKKSVRAKYIYVQEKYYGNDPDLLKVFRKYKDNYKTNKEETIFDGIWDTINNDPKYSDPNVKELGENDKNKIWNYVLLDASTNREYGNSCYAIKRDYIIKKEKGIKPSLDVSETGTVTLEEKNETAFVPICTRNVFSKTYSSCPENLKFWNEEDAHGYLKDLEEKLKIFLD